MRIEAVFRLPREGRFVSVLRDLVRDLLTALDAPADAGQDVELVLTEACGNVIKHADGGSRYRIVVEAEPGRCELSVGDGGSGFDPDAVGEPDPLAEAGRGLMVMEALADELSVETADGGTILRLVRSWTT